MTQSLLLTRCFDVQMTKSMLLKLSFYFCIVNKVETLCLLTTVTTITICICNILTENSILEFSIKCLIIVIFVRHFNFCFENIFLTQIVPQLSTFFYRGVSLCRTLSNQPSFLNNDNCLVAHKVNLLSVQ